MKDSIKPFLKNPIYDGVLWKKVSKAIKYPGYYAGGYTYSGVVNYIKGITDGFYEALHYQSWCEWAFIMDMRRKYGEDKKGFDQIYLQDRNESDAFDVLKNDIDAFIREYDLIAYFYNPPSIRMVYTNILSYQLPIKWGAEGDDTSLRFSNELGETVLTIHIKDISKTLSDMGIDTGKSRARIAFDSLMDYARKNGVNVPPKPDRVLLEPLFRVDYKRYCLCGKKDDGQYYRLYSVTHNDKNVLANYTGKEDSHDEVSADMIISGMQFFD